MQLPWRRELGATVLPRGGERGCGPRARARAAGGPSPAGTGSSEHGRRVRMHPCGGPERALGKQRLPSSHAGRWRGEAAGTDQGLCWRRGVTPGWGPSGQVSERQNQLIDLLSGGGKAKASEDRAPLGPRPGEHTVSADARDRGRLVLTTDGVDVAESCRSFCSECVRPQPCRPSAELAMAPALGAGSVEKTFWSPRPLTFPWCIKWTREGLCEQGTSVAASGLDLIEWVVSRDFGKPSRGVPCPQNTRNHPEP